MVHCPFTCEYHSLIEYPWFTVHSLLNIIHSLNIHGSLPIHFWISFIHWISMVHCPFTFEYHSFIEYPWFTVHFFWISFIHWISMVHCPFTFEYHSFIEYPWFTFHSLLNIIHSLNIHGSLLSCISTVHSRLNIINSSLSSFFPSWIYVLLASTFSIHSFLNTHSLQMVTRVNEFYFLVAGTESCFFIFPRLPLHCVRLLIWHHVSCHVYLLAGMFSISVNFNILLFGSVDVTITT